MPSNPRQKRKIRAGHVKQQSRKQARKRKQNQRESKVTITNPLIAKQWDQSKTLNENFKALGLILDPNNDMAGDESRTANRGGGVSNSQAPKTISTVIQELESIAASRSKSYKAFSSRGEIIFVQSCIRKHGMDYVAMAKDIKLNTYQHTPKQLQAKVKKYVDTIATYCPADSLEELAAAIAQAEDKTKLFLDDVDEPATI
eukprot:m.15398 g.15398  ORF g.15398 m.15398 type:complete len:201 (+) comp10456_c0_seq2:73-675(+)